MKNVRFIPYKCKECGYLFTVSTAEPYKLICPICNKITEWEEAENE